MFSPQLLSLTVGTLLLSLPTGCSSDYEVLVTLSNIPSHATSIAASMMLSGHQLKVPQAGSVSLPLANNQFGIKLPAAGSLILDLTAIDRGQCILAKTQVTAAVSTGLTLVPANLPRTICRDLASPTNNDIFSVWSISDTDIWAVGSNSAVLHYNGDGWTVVTVPVSVNFYGVWASSSKDVWAVGGGGVIIHYDGTAWSQKSSTTNLTLQGISGVDAKNIWAVGTSAAEGTPGPFIHWDGSNWVSVLPPPVNGPLYAVWAGSPNFVVGVGGVYGKTQTIFVFDGSGVQDYSNHLPAPQNSFHAVWGLSNKKVFAVGENGQLSFFDGKQLTSIGTSQLTTSNLHGITGDGSAVYVVGDSLIVRNTAADPLKFSKVADNPLFASQQLYAASITNTSLVQIGGTKGYLGYVDISDSLSN